jgi:nucleolar pre-ribosomal-associated protein 1
VPSQDSLPYRMSKVKRKRDANEDKDEEAEPAAEEAPMSSTSRAATLAAFTGTGADLAASLQTSSLDGLRASLTTLRTLTSRNSHDERLAPSDKRIQLATEFCRAGGIGQSGQGHSDSRGLLNAWDIIDTQEQVTLLPFPLFVLSNIISLLGSHQPTHDLADEIIQTILPASASSSNVDSALSRPTTENHYWNRLQTYLSQSGVRSEASLRGKQVQNKGSQEVVTMSALRLLLEMTTFAGGKYARSVFDNMNWTMKSLPRLLSMRRRTNNSKKAAKTVAKPKNAVTLDRPDIRTLWILFLLSFLCSSTGVNQPVSLQVAILTLGKDFLPAILKGLSNDSPQIVVHVLMALHAGLISDEAAAKLPRSKVVGFFSEWACKELLALYDRETDLVSVAATGERHSIADVVHHFMLALCTHPGRGICYVDQGWHGRQQHVSNGREEDDKESDNEIEGSSTAVFNKILLGLLKSLSPTRSSKQAELTLRILAASKELLSPYLQATTGSLSSASVEPRTMSIAWLSTAAFMGRVLGTPLPEASKWRSLPPSFDRCVHFLLPASLTKSTFIRGIQHKDRLTRHGALILLSRVLDRLHRFKDLCQHMSSLHDEKTKDIHIVPEELSTTEKEEAILRGECYSDADQQKSWMKMCSDVMNEARQQIPDLTTILSSIDVDLKPKKAEEATVAAPPTRSMLIVEAALRSARLHYKVFEEATTSDLGKLLSNASLSSLQADEGPPNMDGDERLSLVCRLHVIQLLTHYAQQNTGGVDLFVRQSGKDTTAFRHLLRLASSPIQDQVRDASRDLIKEAMLGTILFEHNVKEWDVWQYALDKTSDFLLDFFDECVQRCLKTPYRYIEMARVALTEVHDTLCAGPIFFVMLEQYTIRLQSGFLEDNSSKVAFWDFVEQFIPAMLAINGDDMTRPLVTVLRSRIEEAMTSDDERIVNGEMKKISEESRDSIGSAYHTVASKYDSMIARPLVAREYSVSLRSFRVVAYYLAFKINRWKDLCGMRHSLERVKELWLRLILYGKRLEVSYLRG